MHCRNASLISFHHYTLSGPTSCEGINSLLRKSCYLLLYKKYKPQRVLVLWKMEREPTISNVKHCTPMDSLSLIAFKLHKNVLFVSHKLCQSLTVNSRFAHQKVHCCPLSLTVYIQTYVSLLSVNQFLFHHTNKEINFTYLGDSQVATTVPHIFWVTNMHTQYQYISQLKTQI